MTFAARTTLPPNANAIAVTEADAKNRQTPGIVTNNVKGDPGFIWRTGPGEMTILWFKGVDIRQRQRIVALNQHIRPSSQKYW